MTTTSSSLFAVDASSAPRPPAGSTTAESAGTTPETCRAPAMLPGHCPVSSRTSRKMTTTPSSLFAVDASSAPRPSANSSAAESAGTAPETSRIGHAGHPRAPASSLWLPPSRPTSITSAVGNLLYGLYHLSRQRRSQAAPSPDAPSQTAIAIPSPGNRHPGTSTAVDSPAIAHAVARFQPRSNADFHRHRH